VKKNRFESLRLHTNIKIRKKIKEVTGKGNSTWQQSNSGAEIQCRKQDHSGNSST